MITVNGAADYLWNHVVCRAEADRAEPKKEQIIRVPPSHRCLQHALHRHDKEHQLSGRVEPREPEKRAEQIPLGDVNLFAAPVAKHQHRPGNDERVRDEKYDRGIARELEPLIASAVAPKYSADSEQHAQIPKS